MVSEKVLIAAKPSTAYMALDVSATLAFPRLSGWCILGVRGCIVAVTVVVYHDVAPSHQIAVSPRGPLACTWLWLLDRAAGTRLWLLDHAAGTWLWLLDRVTGTLWLALAARCCELLVVLWHTFEKKNKQNVPYRPS